MRPLLVMGSDGTTVDWARTALRMVMYLVGVVVLALGMVVQTESGFNASSSDSGADEELEGMGRTTAYLSQRREIEYDKEIALAIQTFTDKNEVISYDPEYFEHPEEYEKLGYEGVFAITACFSQEPLS